MQIVYDTLTALELGTEITFRNLTLFPLLGDRAGEPDYLTLDEALARKTARITEVSEGGSVPELRFVNEGDRPVLLLDGEELVGAKQNRILNLSILVGARQTILVPVSCVEAGRWLHRSAEFAAASHAHYAAGRARKASQVTASLQTAGERWSDQSEVWADIAAKTRRMATPSPTQAASALYESNETDLDAFVSAFPALDRQVGAVFAIDGEIVGLDLFDYPSTLRQLLPKLIRSYALDALDSSVTVPKEASVAAAQSFLEAVSTAESERFSALGEGDDIRLTARSRQAGGALTADGRIVHLSAFELPPAEADGSAGVGASTLSRPSIRRGIARR